MSWLRIDDAFEDHPKVALLSDAAHRLWMRAACWASKAENVHTNGFVPEAMLPFISRGMAVPKLLKLAKELVDANAGGTKRHGLWEPVEGGWVFHDWEDYRPKPPPMSREESARLAGQRSALVRREKNGTAQPTRSNEPSNVRDSFDERRSEDVRPNETRTSRTPDPVPDPVPRDPKAAEAVPGLPAPPEPPSAAAARPRNLEQALKLPVRERAEFVEREKHLASYVEPQQWPELRAFANAAHEAMGLPAPSLGTYDRDSGVRALVALFAVFEPRDLARAIGAIPGDPWFRSRRGLSAFSPEVVRRLLDEKTNAPSGVTRSSKRQPDYPGERTFSAAEALSDQETPAA